MILLLKRWMELCGLSGPGNITSYALYWLVIFNLQNKSILPSVGSLIEQKAQSSTIDGKQLIFLIKNFQKLYLNIRFYFNRKKKHINFSSTTGWEVGVSHNIVYSQAACLNDEGKNLSFSEYLVNFFEYYANFDFRKHIVCPLIGDVVDKIDFLDLNLPDIMKPYLCYVFDKPKAEPFRIDSVMAIQDPFDLQHNLTKAVSKVYVHRFRTACENSARLLRSKMVN